MLEILNERTYLNVREFYPEIVREQSERLQFRGSSKI